MPEVTIVAIPEQDDRVWKVSSEKVPHLTMLFLGEINDPEALKNVIDYVEHTASIMRRFGLSVDRRGELGPPGVNGREMADVLFFEGHNIDWLNDIRSNLLKNPNVLKGYNSVEQFPTWVPHLTLGFPDTPAKEDDSDFGINWVSFDRLAVWTGDSTGPEFVLPKQDDMATVGWSDSVTKFLAQSGVKGMKWGVRRANKKAARADKKWQKNIYSTKGAVNVHNAAAKRFNTKIEALNAKHPNAHLTDRPNSTATKKYVAAVEAMQLKNLKEAVTEVHGTSPSGNLRAKLSVEGNQVKIVVEPNETRHADAPTLFYTFELEVDDSGHVVSSRQIQTDMAQSDPVKEFISHHGVKGQKWGVRRKRGGSGGSTARTKFKKSPKKLSDAELNKRIKRMELEKKHNELNKDDLSKGRKFVEEVLSTTGRRVATTVLTGGTIFVIRAALERHAGPEVARAVTRTIK